MLQVKNISKDFFQATVLKDISFNVEAGSIAGIIGPNGSGKSTCLKIIAGVLGAQSGVVEFDKITAGSAAWRRIIGYAPEEAACYPDLSVKQYLHFVATLRDAAAGAVDRIIEQCALTAVSGKIGSQLSKGYRQRLNLAQALIHQPRLLILDEPATGLDPEQLKFFHSLLNRISSETTVLLSTHQLSEARELCSQILLIKNGRLVYSKTQAEFQSLSETAALSAEMS